MSAADDATRAAMAMLLAASGWDLADERACLQRLLLAQSPAGPAFSRAEVEREFGAAIIAARFKRRRAKQMSIEINQRRFA